MEVPWEMCTTLGILKMPKNLDEANTMPKP